MITGLLSAVESLMVTVQDSTISLTWTAPFTLDIPFVDPDITYCVCVVNSTSSSTLHSQCWITEAGFSFSIPPDSACHNYTFTFTVTPVNGVGNGTLAMDYYYLQGDCYHDIVLNIAHTRSSYEMHTKHNHAYFCNSPRSESSGLSHD